MIFVVCTLIVCATLLLLRFVPKPSAPDPAQSLGAFLTELSHSHAEDLRTAYYRQHNDQRLVIEALISDRERLVTAVLSQRDPMAARAVGVIDEAVARANARSPRDLLTELAEREAAANTVDYITPEGDAVMPVGMGSG